MRSIISIYIIFISNIIFLESIIFFSIKIFFNEFFSFINIFSQSSSFSFFFFRFFTTINIYFRTQLLHSTYNSSFTISIFFSIIIYSRISIIKFLTKLHISNICISSISHNVCSNSNIFCIVIIYDMLFSIFIHEFISIIFSNNILFKIFKTSIFIIISFI